MKNILSILLIVIVYSGFAQTSNKKRVLIIPASQFEFVTEFDLQLIAKLNETTASKVFLTYEKALLNSFESYNDENFEFVPVDALGLKPYKRLIKYEYGKFDKKHYNGVNLKNFSEADFTKLLDHYDADFVVFITWYDIQKEGFTRKGKHLKRASYAGHYIDFAIYNLFKQQIAGVARAKADVATEPNDLEVSFKFLRIKEVELGYVNFINKVVDQINKPIEQ
mgnify:FL=1|tara:strand:- start:2146 stop:2814 length:669 start_codon:yes stop_codon:yes gene_type:complete